VTITAEMADVDAAPATVWHWHRCWRCRQDWRHEAGDEGCVGVRERTCPECEDSDEADYGHRPWYVSRGR
jgi:hypothetical protein